MIQIRTGDKTFDTLAEKVAAFLSKNVMDVVIDGQRIRGYRAPDARSIWIRDYSDMLRGVRYFEEDVKSTVQHFADTQASNGRIFDYFTTRPEKLPCEKENWTKYVRVPVEADVEFRFVKAAFLAWQATGDDVWIEKLIPRLELALNYATSHPWRWDEQLSLIKRAYTIDTWDFAYTAGKHEWLQFQIDENTYWGIFHGDNSGTIEAMRLLSFLFEHIGKDVPAGLWRKRAALLQIRLNQVCWNDHFYSHFVQRTPVQIPGVNEQDQLSLSNPMAINRGVTTADMAEKILLEYQKRKGATSAFAEWWSIDPPFPDGVFGDEKLVGGAYVNGGIMPLVGGELARAAFVNGFESYGVDILRRYHLLISENSVSYLWYFPDGTPPTRETSTSPEASDSDGWGSTAMLWAMVEGLAGVQDIGHSFHKIRFSPRWPAANIYKAEFELSYAASGAKIQYRYAWKNESLEIALNGNPKTLNCQVLMPSNLTVQNVSQDGYAVPFTQATIRQSQYVTFHCTMNDSTVLAIQCSKKG